MMQQLSRAARKRNWRHFEHLEPKQLLAGDVTVAVVGGDLIVRGDELDNQIAITSGEEPGTYVITGRDGTTLHRASAAEDDPGVDQLVIGGVWRNLAIRMGAGDDRVQIDHARVRGDVAIAGGAGSDVVLIGSPPSDEPADNDDADPPPPAGVRIGGGLRLDTGAGDDTVAVLRTSIRGSLLVATGDGDDDVTIGPRDSLPPDAETTDADDTGDDVSDALRPSVSVGRLLSVRLGSGDDTLSAARVRAGGGVMAFGGEGADSVALAGLRARTAVVHTGPGDDAVSIVDSAFGRLSVALGDGDDSLALGGVSALVALMQGGEGDDTLELLAENAIQHQIVLGFENVPDGELP